MLDCCTEPREQSVPQSQPSEQPHLQSQQTVTGGTAVDGGNGLLIVFSLKKLSLPLLSPWSRFAPKTGPEIWKIF
jgi:hypothetical protein